jgi:putative spermidine/putrescine transport system ATP-binding protein
VKKLHQETGTTFVFVTHDQSEALALSTRVAIFDHGRLQQIGKPDEVYERPANRFVAEFLGEINLLPLDDLKVESGIASGRFEDRRLAVRADAASGTESILAIRPEHLGIAAGAEAPRSGNAVRAALDDIVYQGGVTRLKLRTSGGVPITLSLASQQAAPLLGSGGPFWIHWPTDQGRLLPAPQS